MTMKTDFCKIIILSAKKVFFFAKKSLYRKASCAALPAESTILANVFKELFLSDIRIEIMNSATRCIHIFLYNFYLI